ncbi:MAG TPA: M90 family metallopeptidase [Xanthomonadaceae bacterium]|nr:M90 family metallopeptidase [Xanthomonadaceae bacterium]
MSFFGHLYDRLFPIAAIEQTDWRRTLSTVPLAASLDRAATDRLKALCERFLARKRIVGAADFEPSPDQCRVVAALACLPVLDLGFHWLRGWREVVLYPGGFRVHRSWHDADSGVVTEGPDELAGEAWERGPLILSWEDIAADLAAPYEGFNLVVHEIAHKLDMLTGAADGLPPLPPGLSLRVWTQGMQQAFDDLHAQLDRQEEPRIDPYAAEGPDEFFAVTSEYLFSAPAVLAEAMPDVHALLQRFYRPQIAA